jgi:hypothetical protein
MTNFQKIENLGKYFMKQATAHWAVCLFPLFISIYITSCHTEPLPVQQSTDWTLLQNIITYTPDNTTEQSRTDNSYDSQSRLIGSLTYNSGTLTSKTRDYTYSYKFLSYYDENYSTGQPATISYIRIKYLDVYWTCADTIFTYNQDGTQELNRTINSYDDQYRMVNSVTYVNNQLNSILKNFNYIDKYTYSYCELTYSNGVKTDSTNYKVTYFDDNHLKLKEYITYASDGVTEDSKIDNTYDTSGRLIGSVGYNKGTKIYESHDFVYTGKELNFATDNFTTGAPTVTNHVKYIYFK